MYYKILFFILILNVMRSSQMLDSDKYELVPVMSPNAGNAPFFELPCMIVGGICAKPLYCPEGTRVATKGLCPVQQEQGMECCRPKGKRAGELMVSDVSRSRTAAKLANQEVSCQSKGGECISDHFKCPRLLQVKEATDCGFENTCCAFL